jgi:hypothetical protein
MYKIKRIQRRPSITIPWSFEKYPTSKNFLDHFKKKYIDTKKLLSYISGSMSEDQLKIVYVQVWDTRQDYLDFLTDDVLFDERNEKINYEIDNDITSEFIIESRN